ncbi:hypothetical protein GCM10010990_01530 [Croceicoccus mobilis]|uniref:Uncharacterized protein n=1 Tax=Croceicoccus mobilis TaxID=1703339 RepID=A0A916YQ82_9SPHN|nr:hypothetical protein GCM10010990_01530 [Croceicoccus mobilis]
MLQRKNGRVAAFLKDSWLIVFNNWPSAGITTLKRGMAGSYLVAASLACPPMHFGMERKYAPCVHLVRSSQGFRSEIRVSPREIPPLLCNGPGSVPIPAGSPGA